MVQFHGEVRSPLPKKCTLPEVHALTGKKYRMFEPWQQLREVPALAGKDVGNPTRQPHRLTCLTLLDESPNN